MSAVGAAIVLLFLAGIFWLAVVNPWRAVLAAVFLAPWGGLYIDIGLWLNAFQMVVFVLAMVTFLRALYSDWRPYRLPAAGFLAATLLFAILNSLIQIGLIPMLAMNAADGPLRGPAARAIIQMFMFTFTLSAVPLVAWHLNRPEQARQALRTYLWSIIILAAFGWLQLLIWYGTGNNPMPIGFVSIALGGSTAGVREGLFNLGNMSVYRMNSFAGEPRHLGGAMVIGMMILQAIAATQTGLKRGRLIALWLFFAATTLASWSTSAILTWTVCSIVQFPLARLFGARMRVSGVRIAGFIAIIMLPILLIGMAVEASGFPLFDVISARTIDRIDTTGAVEDFDLAIYAYFADHPERTITGVGLGNIHLYATPYLEPEFQGYALGQVFVAHVGYLRFLSEIGIIGLGMLLTWVLALLIETARALRAPLLSGMVTILPIATIAVMALMITWQYTAEFTLLTGVLSGLCALARRDALRRRVAAVMA
jgi:hypothetical protein